MLPALLRVDDAPNCAVRRDFAGVANLAAHFGVSGEVSRMTAVLSFTLTTSRTLAVASKLIEADKCVGDRGFDLRELDDFFLLRGASALLLFVHQLIEAGLIHGQARVRAPSFGQIQRKAVGIIEFEGKVATDSCPPCMHSVSSRNSSMPAIQRLVECFFLP